MLLRLSSNKAEFKPIMFKPGFNAVVAERAPDSTDQDSRNARGKSTLLAILNYILGGTFDKKMQLLADNGWEFTLELQLFGGTVSATRTLAAGKKLHITATGDAKAFIAPYLVEGQISVEEWKDLLGLGLFRLEPSEEKVTGGISVRTLLSYVIRTEAPKDPLKIVAVQSATSSREHIAFLLDLDWTVVLDLANVDKGLQQLKSITAAARDGLVTTLRPESDLALERVALLNEVEEWEGRIEGFRILEDPNSLVQRADELTAQISVLRDEAVIDGRMRSLYASSLTDDTDAPATAVDVEVLFAAAGAVLADGFVRQMRDVAAFHASLLRSDATTCTSTTSSNSSWRPGPTASSPTRSRRTCTKQPTSSASTRPSSTRHLGQHQNKRYRHQRRRTHDRSSLALCWY